jgi:glutathione S-transferase
MSDALADPVLYSFRRCPYAMRARLALHVAGITVQTREVALRDKPAALLALSPKATVPVLQLPDGRVIDESLDIMLWALRQRDPLAWLATREHDPVLQWVARCDTVFKPLLDRYKYAPRHPELPQQAHRDIAVAAYLGPLNGLLDDQPFICGTRTGWADAAVFPFVRQFAMAEPGWFEAAPLTSLRRWLTYWLDSNWFAAVMAKRPVWADASSCVIGTQLGESEGA